MIIFNNISIMNILLNILHLLSDLVHYFSGGAEIHKIKNK